MKNKFIVLLTIVLLAVSPVAFAAECPLCDATRKGNLSEVTILLENGANVHDKDKDGLTALMLAAASGQSEVAKVLLENGANVHDKDKIHYTAFMNAALRGQNEVAKLLLANGAKVNDKDIRGWTALLEAVSKRKNEVVKFLLENGADANYGDGPLTPLSTALLTGQHEVVKLLLENGANKDDLTDLLLAKEEGHWSISTEINPIDDSKSVFVRLIADEGVNKYGDSVSIMARCKSNTTDVVIFWGDFIGSDDVSVLTRVGKNKAKTKNWIISTNKKATFSKNPIALLKEIMTSDKFLARATPYNENPVIAIFNTTGLKNAIKPLRETCEW